MPEKPKNSDFIEADLYIDEPLYIDLDEPVEVPVKRSHTAGAHSDKSSSAHVDDGVTQPLANVSTDQSIANSADSSVTQSIADIPTALDAHDNGKLDGTQVVDLAEAVEFTNVEATAHGPIPAATLSSTGSSDIEAEIVATEVKELAEPLDPVSARRVAHGLSPLSSAQDTSSKNTSKGTVGSKDANASDEKTGSDGASSGDKGLSSQKRRAEKFRDDRKAERDEKEKRDKRKRIIKAVLIVFIILIVVLAIAFVAALAFIRWGMLDESQAIKGTWRSADAPSEIIITDDRIVLTEDVAYKYTIDTDAKTLVFTFGNLEGHARYRLSLDGKELSIYDTNIEGSDTFFEDAPWLVENLWALILNRELPSADLGAGSELLKRVERVE